MALFANVVANPAPAGEDGGHLTWDAPQTLQPGSRTEIQLTLTAAQATSRATISATGAFQLGVIRTYQVQRLTSFLDPTNSSQAANYNRNQSELTVSSGGLTGTGYGKGTQTNLAFVPEQHTDFIFTVVGEQFGFMGAHSA